MNLEEARALADPPTPPRAPPDMRGVYLASVPAFLLFATFSPIFALALLAVCLALSWLIGRAFRRKA